MGNSSKKDKENYSRIYADMLIKTDKPYYFPGDMVQGNMYVNVKKEGFKGNKIILRIAGKEQSYWTETETTTSTDSDGNSSESSTTYTYTGKSLFYQNQVTLHIFDGQQLPKGQFVFPFKFQLKSFIPGSFFIKGPDYNGKIQYKVIGYILSFSQQYQSIKCTQEFLIREISKVQDKLVQQDLMIDQACCDNSFSTIKCTSGRHNYLTNEIANIKIYADNSQSQYDADTIQAKFNNILKLIDKNGREKLILTTLQCINVPPIRGQFVGNAPDLLIRLQNKNSSIPLAPSVNGRFVQSYYQIQLIADVNVCCQANPFIVFPISILIQIPQNQEEKIEEPPDWNPTIFDESFVCFNDSNKYEKDQNNPGFNIQQYKTQETNFNQMQKIMY